MKTLLLIAAALFIAAASPARAGNGILLKATISGTVQTQTLLGPSDGRIHTAPLNNKRIFQEFQVSTTDYELVVSPSTNGDVLLLVPKHTSAMLPTITVIAFGNDSQVVADTKVRLAHLVSDIATGTATNLFQNLAGEISATLKYVGPVQTPTFTKCNFSVTGHGTDPAAVASSAALLKFKVTGGGTFIEAP